MNTVREKMLAELQLRGITPRTQTAYLREIAKLENYFNRSPEELGEEEVKEYLVHMLEDRGLSSGTSLHHVQLLLGHKSPKTTTVYLHVSKMNLAQVCSPLDSIPEEL